MDEKQQEVLFKLNMFEQQIKYLQEQIRAVEQGIIELDLLNLGLDEIAKSERKDIFASVGRGIFVKAKIESDDLLVDIGEKNFVIKSADETKNLLKEQSQKLEMLKKQLDEKIDESQEEAEKIIREISDN